MTHLATRRTAQAPPQQKSGEATVLGSRRARRQAAEAAQAAQVAPIEDNTQLSKRRTPPEPEPEEDDSTRLADRRASAAESDDRTRMSAREAEAAAPATQSSSYSSESLPAAQLLGSRGSLPSALPPGALPVAMRVRKGGFGTRTPAYGPRTSASANPVLPPPTAQQHLTPQHREPVSTPLEAQRRKDSQRRAAVGRAIAIGVMLVVVGTAAIVGIVLLARGLL